MNNYFNIKITEITHAFESLDEKVFEKLIEDCETALKHHGKIIATGLGKNVPICEKFVGMMNSLGMGAHFMHTNSAMHGDLGMVADNDVVLVLSKSGNTSESVTLYEYIKEWEIKLWLISFNDGGELGKRINNKVVMELPDEGDLWNILPNNSSSIYLIFLQGVAMKLAERCGISRDVFLENHPGGHIGDIVRRSVK